jgi:benzoate-CoA ligase
MTLIPSYFNLFDYFLGEDRLSTIGPQTAIEFRGSRISYSELRREVDYWTDQITSCGVKEGERVALLLYDSPEFIACFLAAVSVGAICVPVNTFVPPEEVMFILSDCQARLMIVEDDLEWKVDIQDARINESCSLLVVDSVERHYFDPKDESLERPPLASTTRAMPAFLLYTSGSTGRPKGAIHHHGSVPVTVESYGAQVLGLRASDRVYSSSRLFFAYGLGNSLSFPLSAGATVILDSVRPAPDHLARLFEEQRPTVFFGVPAVYRALLDHQSHTAGLDLSSVRLCVSAGEALPAKIFEEWRQRFGLTILDGIGSTEMLHIFISNLQGKARAGSSGVVVDGYEARIVDQALNSVSAGEPGNLWVKGGSATIGYWNRDDLTEATIREGWVATGDLYKKDEDGFHYHLGRSDDCFKVRGLWVSPIEVESVLSGHGRVQEAAVVCGADEDGLATVRAFVVIRQGEGSEHLREELRQFARGRLPQYKVPGQIEFITEMPRTSTGKVQRFKLRAVPHKK